MEWSKIKNILIIALALTNLLFIFLIISADSKEPDTDSPVLLSETEAVLKNNGIEISAEIPSVEKEISVLTLTYDGDNGTFFYTGSVKLSPLTEEAAIKTADDFVENLGLPSPDGNEIRRGSCYLSEEIPDTYVVTYGSYYNNCRLEDSYLLCYVTEDGVVRMKKNHASAETSSKSRPKTVPAATALLKYMNQIKTADSNASAEITDITIVYKTDAPYGGNITSDTAFPTWKITSSDGAVSYIPAYN
ncbi:MAG: two-component system regulatory protein YycI [Bacillota bacterium]|nr:two-component system regulatory protein YycI [Bacillota bacterium]